jgi:hypothetical protein
MTFVNKDIKFALTYDRSLDGYHALSTHLSTNILSRCIQETTEKCL